MMTYIGQYLLLDNKMVVYCSDCDFNDSTAYVNVEDSNGNIVSSGWFPFSSLSTIPVKREEEEYD